MEANGVCVFTFGGAGDEEDAGFGHANAPDFKQPERPHWGVRIDLSLPPSRAPHTTQFCAYFAVSSFLQHSRQPAPTLKGKEKSFDESGPEDIHVSEEEEEERPDDERPEDDYAPLSLPTPMFPTPPVMVHRATTYTCDLKSILHV